MKKLLFFATLFAMTFLAKAQVPTEQSIAFNKKNPQGVVLVVSGYDINVVRDALQHRFEKTAALKGKKEKGGFYAYLNQQFADFSSKNLDIYTLVDANKKSGQATISILVSTGNENFISATNDAATFDRVKQFLAAFSTYLREYDINKKISEQNAVLSGLEKERKKMDSDIDKFRKQIADLQAQNLKREKEIESKTVEIERTKTKIQELTKMLQAAPVVPVEAAPAPQQ